MPNKNNRTVFKQPDGTWANKRNETKKSSSVHDTQAEAIEAAHRMLENSGGGELTVMNRKGIIRSKDTIPPGNDPSSIKDTEH